MEWQELIQEAGDGKLSMKRVMFALWNLTLIVHLFVVGPIDWILLTYVMGLGGMTLAGRFVERITQNPS